MRQSGYQSGRLEKVVGGVILLVLAGIAGGVFLQQFQFNPAVRLALNAVPPAAATVSPAPVLLEWLPPELDTFGPVERFTPDNLYDKIDGKAELYLAAGVLQMQCQRYALKQAGDQWLEWSDYRMGNLAQAFSVFSTQRRADGEPLDVTDFAYKTQNAIFFVYGSNYVEAVASSADPRLMNAMIAAARRVVESSPAPASRLPQFELLPAEGRVAGTQTLEASDAFGFDRFKNVFTTRYRSGSDEYLGFVIPCEDAAAATALAEEYRSFLKANGGKALPPMAGAEPIEIMGQVEIVFSRKNVVAGVHAAPSLAVAEEFVGQLNRRLASRIP